MRPQNACRCQVGGPQEAFLRWHPAELLHGAPAPRVYSTLAVHCSRVQSEVLEADRKHCSHTGFTSWSGLHSVETLLHNGLSYNLSRLHTAALVKFCNR